MERTKNGYYTQRHTSNTIAIINGKGFHVAYLPNKFTGEVEKVITNEKITFLDSYLNDEKHFIFEPLRK